LRLGRSPAIATRRPLAPSASTGTASTLWVETPDGDAAARVEFFDAIPETQCPDGVRVAFVRLVRQARTALSGLEGG
jgi:hypothetical protein